MTNQHQKFPKYSFLEGLLEDGNYRKIVLCVFWGMFFPPPSLLIKYKHTLLHRFILIPQNSPWKLGWKERWGKDLKNVRLQWMEVGVISFILTSCTAYTKMQAGLRTSTSSGKVFPITLYSMMVFPTFFPALTKILCAWELEAMARPLSMASLLL